MRRCNRPIQDQAMATLRTPQQAATAVIDNPTLSAGADERVGSYRVVIVGTDGSDSSLRAVDRASVIAAGDGAKLIVATAYFSADDDTRAQDVLKDEGYKVVGAAPIYAILREARDRAKTAGARDIEERPIRAAPVDALVDLVDEVNADLLVVGKVGLNTIAGRLLGSVPATVSRRAKCDVLIVHTTG
jgi:nucleotide-binding universal stress UspA family protein